MHVQFVMRDAVRVTRAFVKAPPGLRGKEEKKVSGFVARILGTDRDAILLVDSIKRLARPSPLCVAVVRDKLGTMNAVRTDTLELRQCITFFFFFWPVLQSETD